MSIYSIIPDPETVLALEPEELAGVVLQYLNSLPNNERWVVSRHNHTLISNFSQYPIEYQARISHAVMEAWAWLEREGLLAHKPDSGPENFFITRRGQQIKNAADLQSYRRADLLPRRLLHPIIAQKVWATFLRGDYDTAVFQAFKEVEVAVRELIDLLNVTLKGRTYGDNLMRQAFNAENGPLADQELEDSERKGMADLFAGAYSLYRNPTAHRYAISDATEAVELIMLASHLRKIVDSRRATLGISTI